MYSGNVKVAKNQIVATIDKMNTMRWRYCLDGIERLPLRTLEGIRDLLEDLTIERSIPKGDKVVRDKIEEMLIMCEEMSHAIDELTAKVDELERTVSRLENTIMITS